MRKPHRLGYCGAALDDLTINVRFINELRTMHFGGPNGASIEARERVRGIEALYGARGFMFERHTPVELRVTNDRGEETQRFVNLGVTGRLAPYLVAPVIAVLIKRLTRAKGR
jgi:hypothetical protein